MTGELLERVTRLIANKLPEDLRAWLLIVRNSPLLGEAVFGMMTAPSKDVLHRFLKLSDDTAELVAEFSELTRTAQRKAGKVGVFRRRRP